MRFSCRPAWALGALGLVVAACGAAEPDRFSLRTPGAVTGHWPPSPIAPRPTPEPTPKAQRAPKKPPVTSSEKRVIKGWSDELRHGHVGAAARYFSIPSLVSNATPDWDLLGSPADVEKFNRDLLPCAAKLVKTRRGVQHFVVGTFHLSQPSGSGACGTAPTATVAVAFRIRRAHITQWVRIDPNAPDPTPTPTPTATPAGGTGRSA